MSFSNLYLDGGFLCSTSASVGLLAGSTVGGGTAVNSMACLPTPGYLVEEWRGLGMEGLEEYSEQVCAVMQRPSRQTLCTTVDGRGQLHDVRGVYVADASALPTAPGINPMISIEAYAAKTAGHTVASLEKTAPAQIS